MHALFLAAYVLLPLVTFWRTRSIAWTVIATTASISVFGLLVNFIGNTFLPLTWVQLQVMALLAFAVPAAAAFVTRPRQQAPLRRQLLAIAAPVLLLGVFFAVFTTWRIERPAYLTPVGFLMGHATAEDNAKWLDFAAFLASGGPIEQSVPMGGPLQLFLVVMATFMAVTSHVTLGGVNEVMVAANTVIYGQFALVVLAPLALAPLAEAKLRRPVGAESRGHVRIPWPLIWIGSLILVSAVLMLTAYGHLTLQWTMLIGVLWATTYLIRSRVPRALVLTSIAVIAGLTVWFPLIAVSIALLIGWLVVSVVGIIRGARSRSDWLVLGVLVIVAIALLDPVRSAIVFVFGIVPAAAVGGFGGIGGVGASAGWPVWSNLLDSELFAAGGGTEVTTPLLMVLAGVGALAASAVVTKQGSDRGYVRLIPLLLLAGFALTLNVVDQWATGGAPNYGSYKFTFMVVIVVAAATLPVGLMLLDPRSRGMTPTRWVGVGVVIIALVVDPLLVRSVAAARPEQWYPPIPFDNPRSYWWPAEVNGEPEQPISENPIGCVYLPAGAKAPSGILESGLSDPQRVYSCTRLLAGLAGEDAGAQPMVDWLRREWLTNTRAWTGVYGYLAGMPDEVLDRPVILLDDGSNVIGLESMRSLLARYPAEAGEAW